MQCEPLLYEAKICTCRCNNLHFWLSCQSNSQMWKKYFQVKQKTWMLPFKNAAFVQTVSINLRSCFADPFTYFSFSKWTKSHKWVSILFTLMCVTQFTQRKVRVKCCNNLIPDWSVYSIKHRYKNTCTESPVSLRGSSCPLDFFLMHIISRPRHLPFRFFWIYFWEELQHTEKKSILIQLWCSH